MKSFGATTLKKASRVLLVGTLCWLQVACSVQWREGDASAVEPRVAKAIDALRTSSQGSGTVFMQLYDSPTSSIYFAISDIGGGTAATPPKMEMGPPWSVLSIIDFNVFGRSDIGAMDLAAAMVVFIDDPASGRSALVVDFAAQNEQTYTTRYYSSTQAPSMDGEELVVTFDGLTLRTYDVDSDGVLDSVVQFRVYARDSGGNEAYVGKFSSLIGYQ